MLCGRKNIFIVDQKRINEFQTLCGGFNEVELVKLCNVVHCGLNTLWVKLIKLGLNLALV